MAGAGDVGVELVLALRALPAELRRQVRPALLEAAQPIVDDARRRASFSRTIPKSIVPRLGFGQHSASVRLVARRDVADRPVRAFEGLQRGARPGLFRHPVFGRDRYVDQPTRPFLGPALDAGRDEVLEALTGALTSSAAAAGWRN